MLTRERDKEITDNCRDFTVENIVRVARELREKNQDMDVERSCLQWAARLTDNPREFIKNDTTHTFLWIAACKPEQVQGQVLDRIVQHVGSPLFTRLVVVEGQLTEQALSYFRAFKYDVFVARGFTQLRDCAFGAKLIIVCPDTEYVQPDAGMGPETFWVPLNTTVHYSKAPELLGYDVKEAGGVPSFPNYYREACEISPREYERKNDRYLQQKLRRIGQKRHARRRPVSRPPLHPAKKVKINKQ